MGVYIPGMEMPANCCQCPVNAEVCKREYKYLLKHLELYDKRADDCPLVPVPEFSDIGSDPDDVWKKIFSLVVLLLSDREKFDKLKDDVLADLEVME